MGRIRSVRVFDFSAWIVSSPLSRFTSRHWSESSSPGGTRFRAFRRRPRVGADRRRRGVSVRRPRLEPRSLGISLSRVISRSVPRLNGERSRYPLRIPQLNIFRSSFRSWLTVTADSRCFFRASRYASMSPVLIWSIGISPNVWPTRPGGRNIYDLSSGGTRCRVVGRAAPLAASSKSRRTHGTLARERSTVERPAPPGRFRLKSRLEFSSPLPRPRSYRRCDAPTHGRD